MLRLHFSAIDENGRKNLKADRRRKRAALAQQALTFPRSLIFLALRERRYPTGHGTTSLISKRDIIP